MVWVCAVCIASGWYRMSGRFDIVCDCCRQITASSMGTILHYCRQGFKHNSNFILKMVADLIELKMWPLCKRGAAESMDGPGHPWMSRNGRIYGWPGPSVDVEK